MPRGNVYIPNDIGYLGLSGQEQASRPGRITSESFANTMDFSDNSMVGNNFSAGTQEWDDWLRWDGTPDIIDPSLVQKPMIRDLNLGNQGNQQWQNGLIDQSTNTIFDDMDIQDGLFELETPSLSPTTTIEGSLQSSSSSPIMESNLQNFNTADRTSSKSATSTKQASSAASKQAPAKPTRGRGKRRKTANMDEADLNQTRKRGHNAIEKRYRTNLNERIIALKESVPSLRASGLDETLDDDEDCGRDQKFGKAAILTKAVEYITHLEESTKRLGAETNALKARVSAFESLAMSGSNEAKAPSYSPVEPAQTLESIQAEFLLKNSEKEKTPTAPTKRKNSKKT